MGGRPRWPIDDEGGDGEEGCVWGARDTSSVKTRVGTLSGTEQALEKDTLN